MNELNNVIGMINPLGSNSFVKNNPLDIDSIEQIVVRVDEINVYSSFSNVVSAYLSTFDDDQYILSPPLSGISYKELILNILNLYRDYEFLIEPLHNEKYIYTIFPFGLFYIEEPISLCFLSDVDNNKFLIEQKKLLPFELSEDKIYIVVNIEKSDNNITKDRTFNTISIIDKIDDSVKTYIRMVGKNNRWSDWLEYTDDISINLNAFKLVDECKKLQKYLNDQLTLPTIYYNNTEYNSTSLDNNILSINCFGIEYLYSFNKDSDYKGSCSNLCYILNHSLDLLSYFKYVEDILCNNIYTPKQNELTYSFMNEWLLSHNNT